MNNFVFKIFGAPNTFDLYQGSEGEIRYFQNFDNGGKENAKLTIHRMASGKVSYSYLRYNFLSSGGRSNSFFGMSVLFDNEYCNNIEKIFELFDVVYKNVILKNSILLTELKKNPTAQAKYLVSTFVEADAEVRNVENNIINNLKNHFADDILPIDSSFLESNSMVQLNDRVGNAKFVSALRKCSWVHISPDYSKNENPIPNHEFLKNLDDKIEVVQKQMPILSVNALKGISVHKEANNYLDKINESLIKIRNWLGNEYKLHKGTNINSYLQRQPELKSRYDKLLEIQKSLKDLLNVVGTPIPVLQSPTGTDLESPNPSTKFQSLPNVSIWQEHGIKIIIGGAILFMFMLVYYSVITPLNTPTENKTTNNSTISNKTEKLISDGNTALQDNKFDDAISKFRQAGKTDLVEIAKTRAVEYWYEQAGITSDLQIRKKYFENAKKYGGYPSTDNDIADVQNQIDKQITNAKRVRKKIKAQDQSDEIIQQVQVAPTCINVNIHIANKKGRYSIGDTFEATATSSVDKTLLCTGGEWKFDSGLWASKDKNPTQVEIRVVPTNGVARLKYFVGNEVKATYIVNIVQ